MKLNDIFEAYPGYGRSVIPVDIQLYRDENDENPMEIELSVEYTVEPSESEGPYTYYQGGYVVEAIKLAHNFEFNGRQYKRGMTFPKELIPHVDDGELDEEGFYQYIESKIDGDIDVPHRTYPMS